MYWLAYIASAIALLWLATALFLLSATSRMAKHTGSVPSRRSAAAKARVANSVLLLCQAGLLLLGILLYGRSGPLVGIITELTQILFAALVVAYMLIIVVTLSLPDLPGRAQLRTAENVCAVIFALILGTFSVTGVRVASDAVAPYGSAGALALMFGFFVLGRPYLRGSIIVLARITQQGTPDREATLKRLLRRFRPFVVGSALALLAGAIMLQSARVGVIA